MSTALGRTSTAAYYWTIDVAENMDKSLSSVQRTDQGKDFKLILMLKVETRHPIRGPFGHGF